MAGTTPHLRTSFGQSLFLNAWQDNEEWPSRYSKTKWSWHTVLLWESPQHWQTQMSCCIKKGQGMRGWLIWCFIAVVQSLGMSDSLQPHGLQHPPGFPVLPYLPEVAQTHVHWVSDAIQPSHPLLLPSPPAFSLSHNQGLFQWVSSLPQVAKVLELQL